MMTYQQFYDLCIKANQHFEKGEFAEALKVFQSIVESDLPELDRATMCVNVATVCDRMGHESHAVAWFDHGVALEEPHSRCFVAEKKAEYLVGKGRKAEALAIYDALAEEPFVTMADLERIKHNQVVLRGGGEVSQMMGRQGV